MSRPYPRKGCATTSPGRWWVPRSVPGGLVFREPAAVHQQGDQRRNETETSPADTAPLAVHGIKPAIHNEKSKQKREGPSDGSSGSYFAVHRASVHGSGPTRVEAGLTVRVLKPLLPDEMGLASSDA